MMRVFIYLSFLLSTVTAQAAECLAVKNKDFKTITNNHGVATLEWRADVRNNCEAPYDGRLMIDFVGSEGQVLQETLLIVILQQNASEQVSKQVALPAESYAALDATRVTIEERERPI